MIADSWIKFPVMGPRIRDLGWDMELPKEFHHLSHVYYVLPRSIYRGQPVNGLFLESLDPKDVTTHPRDTDLPRLYPWRNVTVQFGRCLIVITPLLSGKTEKRKFDKHLVAAGRVYTHGYYTDGLLHDLRDQVGKLVPYDRVLTFAKAYGIPAAPVLYSGLNKRDVIRSMRQPVVIDRIAATPFKTVLRDYENPIP